MVRFGAKALGQPKTEVCTSLHPNDQQHLTRSGEITMSFPFALRYTYQSNNVLRYNCSAHCSAILLSTQPNRIKYPFEQ